MKEEWLAALIDCEGNVSITLSKVIGGFCACPKISIANDCLELLETARNVFGGSIQPIGARSHCLLWTFEEAAHIAKIVLPFSIVKRKQLELLVKFCTLRRKGMPYSEEEKQIVKQIYLLNSDKLPKHWEAFETYAPKHPRTVEEQILTFISGDQLFSVKEVAKGINRSYEPVRRKLEELVSRGKLISRIDVTQKGHPKYYGHRKGI